MTDDLGETTVTFETGMFVTTGLEPSDTLKLEDAECFGMTVQICARIWCDLEGMHAEPLWFQVLEDGQRVTGAGLTILQAEHDMWPVVKRIVRKHFHPERLDRFLRCHSKFEPARRMMALMTDNVVVMSAARSVQL